MDINKLTIEHLITYLPYELQFHLPMKIERYSGLIEEEPWIFTHTLEEATEHGYDSAIALATSKYFQKEPFLAIENGEVFLGCLESHFGWDLDDVFAHEVKPILRPLSDIPDDMFQSFGFADEENFQYCVYSGIIPHSDWIRLVKEKYDVFGLIDAGLAIDINITKK